ncbi:MAG: C1 family peptidase [Candidatus Zixiibacteriota bacterium]
MRTSLKVFSAAIIVTLALSTCVLAGDGGIDSALLEQYEKQFNAEGNQQRTINAITNNSIKELALNRDLLTSHDKLVAFQLKDAGVVDQKGSGRCWMFAGVNVLSPVIMKKLDLSSFELSEPYITFYDKLEKSNFFLERVIEMRDRPIDDRSLQMEIDNMIGDGGWWHYFTDLVEKYGIVPLSAMPETKQSISTGTFNSLAQSLLRADASQLRQMHKDGKSVNELRQAKEKMLADIYKLLVYNYGRPPKEFTFRWEAKKDSVKTISEKNYTPKSFLAEYFPDGLPNYVALVNNPTLDYDQPYLLEASRNIYENSDFKVLNLPVERLKEYTHKALLDSQAVWFACDVGKQNYGDSAIMAEGILDYGTAVGMDFALSKADKISFKEISPNHAMVICGFDTTSTGTINKWLIENSWGKKAGDDGFWYMYDDWFSEYVLVIVINENMLSPEDAEKFKKEPVKVADWEPFFRAMRNLE